MLQSLFSLLEDEAITSFALYLEDDDSDSQYFPWSSISDICTNAIKEKVKIIAIKYFTYRKNRLNYFEENHFLDLAARLSSFLTQESDILHRHYEESKLSALLILSFLERNPKLGYHQNNLILYFRKFDDFGLICLRGSIV